MISVHSCPLAALGGKETGGMNVYIRELSKELAKRGCHVDIFTRSQNAEIPMVVPFKAGIRIIHLKAGPEAPYDKNQVWSHLPEFLDNLEHFTREEQHKYHLIHSHYWLSGWVGAEISIQQNVPLLHMFHTMGYFKNRATKPLGEHEPPIRLEIEAQLVKHADHLMVSNRREKVQMVWTYGVPAEKISVIPCGVDPSLFRPRNPVESKAHLGLPDKRYILFVGRIDPVKGIDTLLRAIKLVKGTRNAMQDVHLLIIGGELDHTDAATDSEINKLKRLTGTLGIKDRVTFLGAQRQDQLPYFYAAADMCILPSRYESFGMVALEAMACGTPVIASKVGGLASFIQNELSGLLIPEEDEVALAEKILLLLTDPSFKDTLGGEARSRALEFSWPVIAEQVLSLYQGMQHERTAGAKDLINSSLISLEGKRAALDT
jgi:D-inositol-3-phosphate glycosyltransferase